MVILNDNFSFLEVIVPFCYCIVYFVSFLFCGPPFPLYVMCVIEMLWEILFNHVLVIVVLHLHHLIHLCRLYIILLDPGSAG